jgi:hypothetical protein
MATQQQLALQMIAQLRVLDPSISAEIGTPERKIIDTVAQSLAENQIDLGLLEGAFDLDSKFGTDLDKFLSIFGFGRQLGTQATGFITFSRPTTSNYDIPIPSGTQVVAPAISLGTGATQDITFATSESVTLRAGDLQIIAPIQSLLTGVSGNVAANTITTFGRTPILGITAVINEIPTSGGLDAETDDEFKVRFKNTVFRNLAGTYDQFLALAVSTAFTTKANVVGPISRYREYVQIPDVDDASPDPDSGLTGGGNPNDYTTAMSTVPYSKYTYQTVPYFVSNGAGDLSTVFYREDIDFNLNSPAINRGDTFRAAVAITAFQPNLTFVNVYTGLDPAVVAIRPKDVVLFEHSYMSSASRNDYTRQILNCVDVFINGENPQPADVVFPRPSGTRNLFNAVVGDRLYVENYRRVGEPNRRPALGNIFSPLYLEPAIDLPDTITTADATYTKGIHYWVIEDVSELGGTVRARNGIEWAVGVNGQAQGNPAAGPFTGPSIVATADTSILVESYFYDRNIADLQIALEGSKQVTTDVLAHKGTKRRFKLDLTIMYSQGASVSATNDAIQTAITSFFEGQYFGTVIQLSDILTIVHDVPGVDNVRWSKELLSSPTDSAGSPRNRITEVDESGNALLNVLSDYRVYGGTSVSVQQIYITGSPTGGTFVLTFDNGSGISTSAAIAYNASASTVQAQARAVTGDNSLTVTGSGTATDPWVATFATVGARNLIQPVSSLTGGDKVYNSDFFLADNELPALPSGALATDSVPGLILRPRAQNTWNLL